MEAQKKPTNREHLRSTRKYQAYFCFCLHEIMNLLKVFGMLELLVALKI